MTFEKLLGKELEIVSTSRFLYFLVSYDLSLHYTVYPFGRIILVLLVPVTLEWTENVGTENES